MSRDALYRVPDVIDVIYKDVVHGLYSPGLNIVKKNRIIIAKCNLACDFLINSPKSEEDISEDVDFVSIDEFRRVFKGFLGIFPLEFRKRFSNN